jgi:hypothetical protein
MVLEAAYAQRFINGYSALLLTILGEAAHDMKGGLVPKLAAGRAKMKKHPELFQEARAKLASQTPSVDPEVMEAVEGLDLRQWIYLRDTKLHSIFVDPSIDRAFGVLGLTERLRAILGGSGASIETGLVRYKGRFVCDGVFARTVWLGSSYKKSFNERFRLLKAEGKFHVQSVA